MDSIRQPHPHPRIRFTLAATVVSLALAFAASVTIASPANAIADPSDPVFATTGLQEVSGVVALGNTLYFTAYQTGDDFHLFSYDGTTVAIVPSGSVEPQETPLRLGDSLYFRGFDYPNGDAHLYRFDGTSVAMVPGSPRQPNEATLLGDKIFLRASVGDSDSYLFTYDGATWHGYSGVADPKGVGSFAYFGDSVYMVGYDAFAQPVEGSSNNYLYGLTGGQFTAFNGPAAASEPQHMTAFNGNLYYSDFSCALGRFDGATFTRIDPAGGATCASSFAPFRGSMFFSGLDGNRDFRLSSTDGVTTTVIPGSPLDARNLTVYNGVLYFSATVDGNSVLFSFDGTNLTQVESSADAVDSIAIANGALYYGGTIGLYGERAFWSIHTDALPQAITLPATSIAAGASMVITGSGFTPNSLVTVDLHSTPVTVGRGHADTSGYLYIPITIPDAATAGPHELWVTDGATGHTTVSAVTVTRAAAAAELSRTSAPVVPVDALIVIFSTLIAAGALLGLAARRSRRVRAGRGRSFQSS